MGVAELRDAFNEVAEGYGLTCAKATMGYERSHDTEWQILTFYGTGPDGSAFTMRADRARESDNLLDIAKVAAQRLVDQRAKMVPAPQPDPTPAVPVPDVALAVEEQKTALLDQVWQEISALGGPEDQKSQAYKDAIGGVLELIEKLGGMNPDDRATIAEQDAAIEQPTELKQ